MWIIGYIIASLYSMTTDEDMEDIKAIKESMNEPTISFYEAFLPVDQAII